MNFLQILKPRNCTEGSSAGSWVVLVGEFADKLKDELANERDWAANKKTEVQDSVDIDRECSFELWGIEAVARAQKVMKNAKPKVNRSAHHVEASKTVTNKNGKTRRI